MTETNQKISSISNASSTNAINDIQSNVNGHNVEHSSNNQKEIKILASNRTDPNLSSSPLKDKKIFTITKVANSVLRFLKSLFCCFNRPYRPNDNLRGVIEKPLIKDLLAEDDVEQVFKSKSQRASLSETLFDTHHIESSEDEFTEQDFDALIVEKATEATEAIVHAQIDNAENKKPRKTPSELYQQVQDATNKLKADIADNKKFQEKYYRF